MIRLFAGYDEREAAGWHVFMQSVVEKASHHVAVTPLYGRRRDGTNAFTYTRFMVPFLCNFSGWAIFADGADMMLRADISELMEHCDNSKAVLVVKHSYETRHPRKYIGTRMASDNVSYPRKNWSSVMLWNCSHPANALIRPVLIDDMTGEYLHRFSWLRDEEIGELPPEWNHLVRECAPNPEAKLVHWTLGMPGFLYYAQDEFSDEWRQCATRAARGQQANEPVLHP